MSITTVATRDGRTTTLAEDAVEGFRQRLRGRLLYPTDEGFEEATRLWNGMIVHAPAIVVQPTGTADVVAAVDFAREYDLSLSVKGGGHNIAGTALTDGGMTIDMSRLRGVFVDPEARTATAQAGCLLGDVDRETQLHGLATPLGFVSETGVAGLTLGGGFGYLTRRFGWTVDNLLEVEIVTADGRVHRASRAADRRRTDGPTSRSFAPAGRSRRHREAAERVSGVLPNEVRQGSSDERSESDGEERTANREENSDLFWAIRGAGANLGVVTSFTYRLHEVGPTVYGGLIAWPFERADEILSTYREITARAPRELTAFLLFRRAPPAPFVPPEWHGERICAMTVCYTGDLADTDEVLAPIRALGDPVVDLLQEQPYTQLQSYLDATQPKGNHYYWKTEFASELGDDMLATMRELASECPIPDGQLVFAHIGGALNEHGWDDGAVGNRDARFAYGAAGMWEPDDPDADSYRQWVRDAWERFRPFSTGGNYVNFQTADEDEDRVRATYGENFDRLVEVKSAYDPENVFQSNRNVRPRVQAGRE